MSQRQQPPPPPGPPIINNQKLPLWGPSKKQAEQEAAAKKQAEQNEIIRKAQEAATKFIAEKAAAEEAAKAALVPKKLEAFPIIFQEPQLQRAIELPRVVQVEQIGLPEPKKLTLQINQDYVVIPNRPIHEEFNNINTYVFEIGKTFFDSFVFKTCYDLGNSTIDFRKKNALFFDVNNVIKHYDPEYPAIYITGGSAYMAYDKFLLKDKSQINRVTPKTVDYDITCCVNNFDTESLKKFILFITTTNYNFLNDLYIKDNFDDIRQDHIKLEEHESLIGVLNNKLIITSYQHPKYKTSITFRFTLVRFDFIERIVDLYFTTQEEVFNKVKQINIINIGNNIYHNVPECTSLIKLSLLSLINRGNNNRLYKNCIKDYMRLKYFFDLLNKQTEIVRNTLGYTNIVGKDNTVYKQIFDFIAQFLPHCSKKISDSEININFFNELPSRAADLFKLQLASILDSQDPPTKDVFEEYKTKINKYIESSKLMEYINKHTVKQTGGNDIYYSKYLKYKKKYLALKKIEYNSY